MGSYGFQPWGELLHSVKTGETAFDHVHGMSFWDYLGKHPEDGRLFDESMTNFSGPDPQGESGDEGPFRPAATRT